MKQRAGINLKTKLGIPNIHSRNGVEAKTTKNIIAEAIKSKIRQAQEKQAS
jgi:hypothetical protein